MKLEVTFRITSDNLFDAVVGFTGEAVLPRQVIAPICTLTQMVFIEGQELRTALQEALGSLGPFMNRSGVFLMVRGGNPQELVQGCSQNPFGLQLMCEKCKDFSNMCYSKKNSHYLATCKLCAHKFKVSMPEGYTPCPGANQSFGHGLFWSPFPLGGQYRRWKQGDQLFLV